MCGRVNVSDHQGIQALMEMLGIPLWPNGTPRWNIAPSSHLTALAAADPGTDPHANSDTLVSRELEWGITPPWIEPGQSAKPLINARSETLFTKPTFRDLALQYRAVVPVNGFYEWQRDEELRIPWYVESRDWPAMLLAVVYQPASRVPKRSQNVDHDSKPQMGFKFDDAEAAIEISGVSSVQLGQFAVVTTAALGQMANIHHRTPVMLAPEDAKQWLQNDDIRELETIIGPNAVTDVQMRQVNSAVNSVRNDGPECTLAVAQQRG